jgi:ABC-type antimicrobial peptide transport system permease subunit
MQELKKIGVFSLAKIEALLGAIIGFIVGIIVAFIGTASLGLIGMYGAQVPRTAGLLFGVAAIVIFPLLYAVIGFIVGAIVAFLYNVVAGWAGGIEVELVECE